MRRLALGDVVPFSAAKVWSVIGDFSGMYKWAPIVEAESTEVTPKGKVRTLTLRGGRTVVELTDKGRKLVEKLSRGRKYWHRGGL